MRFGESPFAEKKEPLQKEKLEILKEQGIVTFDANLSFQEKRAADEVRIEIEAPDFAHFGPVDATFVQKVKEYFASLGENSEQDIQTLTGLVVRMTKNALQDLRGEAVWVALRSSLPNDLFNTPRWHADGKYFPPAQLGEKSYKLVMAIKGLPTRFAEVQDAQRFAELAEEQSANYASDSEDSQENDLRIRKELDLVVSERKPLMPGEAAYYLVGDEEAKVHSEPKADQPRIFLSVVVGSAEQIQSLQTRWAT